MSDNNDPLDLRELLGKTSADYPSLPDFPAEKTFYGKTTGLSMGESKGEKKTPYFAVGVRLTDPGPDVPEEWLQKLKAGGFSIADYNAVCKFYLTPNAVKMNRYGWRAFLDSLGFPANIRWDEGLKLNPENLQPTEETQEIFRGRDVLCRTKSVGENGSVYSGEFDSIAGIKRS